MTWLDDVEKTILYVEFFFKLYFLRFIFNFLIIFQKVPCLAHKKKVVLFKTPIMSSLLSHFTPRNAPFYSYGEKSALHGRKNGRIILLIQLRFNFYISEVKNIIFHTSSSLCILAI